MIKSVAMAIAICCAVRAANAQVSAPSWRSTLPNASSITLNNAAGALKYCLSKQLVSTTSATAVVEALPKKRVDANSSEFAAGAAGQILGDNSFSIGMAPGFLQSQSCDLVLKRAKQFL